MSEDPTFGFRIASPVPANAVPIMNPLGLAMLFSLLGIAAKRRSRD